MPDTTRTETPLDDATTGSGDVTDLESLARAGRRSSDSTALNRYSEIVSNDLPEDHDLAKSA